MAKYSFEFKLQVVNEYLRGDAGYWTLSKRYGIDTHVIRRWISSYTYIATWKPYRRWHGYYNLLF